MKVKLFFLLIAQISLHCFTLQATDERPRICLIGAHDPAYDHIGIYAHQNKVAYAMKHGYDVKVYTEHLDLNRLPYWGKIVALRMHLKDYDWLFWLDSDALILNGDIKLESIIDDNYDFITTRDCLGCLNSGMFLIKNTPWSQSFLDTWYSEEYKDVRIHPGADNAGLIGMLRDMPQLKEKVKVIPQRYLSSYLQCSKLIPIDGAYQEGDFIIHFAGVPHDRKEAYMEKWFQKAIK